MEAEVPAEGLGLGRFGAESRAGVLEEAALGPDHHLSAAHRGGFEMFCRDPRGTRRLDHGVQTTVRKRGAKEQQPAVSALLSQRHQRHDHLEGVVSCWFVSVG